MICGYRLTHRASEGLLRIATHVEQHFGHDIAHRVIDDLQRGFELLATNPDAGHRRRDLARDEDVRFWAVGPTLIADRSAVDWIDILFVERADLNWERLLAEREE